MSIGKVDSVDLAALRQAPPSAPLSSNPIGLQDLPAFEIVEPASQEAVVAAIQAANAYAQSVSTNLQFSLDQDSGRTIVKMIDTATDEIIRQFPSEEMLAISKSIVRMQGLLVNRKV